MAVPPVENAGKGAPTLALGMILHKPGHAPGRNATAVLRDIHRRDHPARWLGGDRLFTDAKPTDYHLPVRALRYQVVQDYKVTQLGIQAPADGAIMVEGTWYCPSMPVPLIEATLDYRERRIDFETYLERIDARLPYRLRRKERPDGYGRWACPAAGPKPTVACEAKPKSLRPVDHRPRILVLPANLPTVCAQASITTPPSAGARFAQELHSAAGSGS